MSCVRLLITVLVFATTRSIDQRLFKTMKGYKLIGGTPLRLINARHTSSAFCANQCTALCGSATYSPTHNQCITYTDQVYDSSIRWTQESDWWIIYRNEPIQHGEWTMVFRAQKDINISLYDLWGATGHHDDKPLSSDLPLSCYRLDNFGTCTRHFRSYIIDNWVNIDKVKFSLFTNGTEVSHMIFNGSKSTVESWYTKSGILNSSWTYIRNDSSVLYFDVSGFYWNRNLRRFAICGVYKGCPSDSTYFMAIDTSYDDCTGTWSLPLTSYPVFVYSPVNRIVTLSKGDYLATKTSVD